MKSSTVWLWVLGLLSGCLPSQKPLDDANADVTVRGLQVRDTNHGVWPPQAMARNPRFQLWLDGALGAPEKRVFLIRGALDPDTEADLLDPPLRESTEDRLLGLTFSEAGPEQLVAAPDAPIEPGQDLTLAVLETSEKLWSQALHVSTAPAAGAAFVESLPASQARGVPTNLNAAWLRFDGYLDLGGAMATLESSETVSPLPIQSQRCSELGLPDGDCLRLAPAAPLPAQSTVTLRLVGLRDGTGAPLGDLTISVQTGDADETVPAALESACALDERFVDQVGCLLELDTRVELRLTVDEPLIASVAAGSQVRSAFSFGADVQLFIDELSAGVAVPATLTLTDLAGNLRTAPLLLSPPADLPDLSIEEIRPDPLGPEPAQEMIELLNFGSEPIELQGFFVSDDASDEGVRIVDALRVLPSERVLVVAPDFDPRERADGMLSPGVRIARTDKALSLSNEGEPLFLRDPSGRRVSAAPRQKPAREGACLARSAADRRSAAADAFRADPNQTCTPGTETIWP